jgi:hypothetical protein
MTADHLLDSIESTIYVNIPDPGKCCIHRGIEKTDYFLFGDTIKSW